MLSTKWIFPACGGLVLALAGIQANATVLATSDLEIQSLTVSSDNLEAITIIGGTRNGTTTVNFDGDIPTPLSDVKAALDDVDLAPLCAGPDCGSVPYTGDNASTTELQPQGS